MSTEIEPMGLDRRTLFRRSAVVAAAVALAGPFEAYAARMAGAKPAVSGAGYGPLSPVRDQTTGLELLKLPRGFEYLSFGWTGDVMSDGIATPGAHDGMAAFRLDAGIHLVRNHEKGAGAPFLPGTDDATYDPAGAGGTTTLVFDPDAGALVRDHASLSGTIRNCAGGPTPWGSWLTCEETTLVSADGTRHGYVFDVPADGKASGTPLKAMGRFSHEAVAIDPATGIVYLTEDAGSSALYRFTPATPGDMTEGLLEAMVLEGTTDTKPWTTGTTARISGWVKVDNPDWAPGELSTWRQVEAKGAARISRGEGAWYGNGVVYVVSTNGGPAGQGQIFALDPGAQTFRALFVSPSAGVLNAPDNICVSPRGGLVLCEDGSGLEYLHGLTPGGEIFPFAENAVVIPAGGVPGRPAVAPGSYTGAEWCGAVFEPKNGNWLFANIQSPGITFAITGPWRQGSL